MALTNRALVLGGGGTLGIAWMAALAAALAENGIGLNEADLFVGTSAGSVVGTQLAFGMEPEIMLGLERMQGDAATGFEQESDPRVIAQVFQKWWSVPEMTPELQRELGALALSAPTISEERWTSLFEATLQGAPWPEKPLKITAVDALSGELVVWDRESGAPLFRAVASSCAVPGLLPCTTIGDRRYMDGGVRSGTNADLAAGCERVLIIAPMAVPERQPLASRQVQAEITGLRAGGSQVELVLPDKGALEAFGPNMMDATRRSGVIEAGLRQGQALAERLASFWG